MNITDLKGMSFDTFEEFKAYVEGNNKPKEKKIKKVGLAYPAFEEDFAKWFKDFRVIQKPEDVNDLDLIVFSGGEDVSPSLYGERNNYCGRINSYRDEKERVIYQTAKKLNKKMFGVCRGHQFLNVMEGGKLYQDYVIQGEGEYRKHGMEHPIECISNSSLVNKYYNGVTVNSYHHQAVRIANNLRTTMVYKGIIEATESRSIIAVQFHPEWLDDNATKEFFKFIEEEW